jgi:hypothetical protein
MPLIDIESANDPDASADDDDTGSLRKSVIRYGIEAGRT